MRAFTALYLGVATLVTAQDAIEPADFDVKAALLRNGVDVSTIPALLGLVESKSPAACSTACSALKTIFGDAKVVTQNTPAYDAFTNSYWSVQQASVDPYCIFKSSTPLDVSTVVLLARLTQCPFAVRSGGHAAFAGASNIQSGITISLQNLNEVVLSEDKSAAAIGPGNVWYDVYTKLEPKGLAVIGGRVAAIGVGGLTLGGGISFFSNIYGWACDNVLSYEVVTASGLITTASPTTHSDLYWALRGGGPNFGIVTKFNLRTIQQGLMWGGGRLHLEPQFPAVIKAFYNLGRNAGEDTNAAQILSFAYAQSTKFASVDLQYAKPVADAPILAEYLAIPDNVTDTTRIRSLADLTVQFNASNPSGLRETYWAATFKLDQDFTSFIKDVFFEEIDGIVDAAALVPAATLQVITEPQLSHMSQNGGNPLGLSVEDGPLILLNLNMMWSHIADDERILLANSNIIKRTVAEAEARGLANQYIYMNYASQFQDVIGSYGKGNEERLRRVAGKYDPTSVFQRLQPGYFGFGGAVDGGGV
ncbi:FAD binding domain-containing protein [Lophiotrema nucula]|uniref:FAD binding domain-containing protein n=1 Tax=Lophiotrema nucula TaxID=690887 RepID=A0A6A5YWL5_9PLEO|nr:FAD binding domain-containing protein [Lophiotrema nucula]